MIKNDLKRYDMEIPKRWLAKWDVPGSKVGSMWVVAVNNYGEFGCSCPVWRFKRKECKHILRIRMQGSEAIVTKQSMESFVKNSDKLNKNVEKEFIEVQSIPAGRKFDFD